MTDRSPRKSPKQLRAPFPLKRLKGKLFAGFAKALKRLGLGAASGSVAAEIYALGEQSYQPGPEFEDLDPDIGAGKSPRAKVIAFYLPQFHEFEENNRNWGRGFTEWTNLARNIPRYRGHLAPRIPRDLGFYDLSQGDIHRRQAKMARQAGVHAFCYYYYRFDGRPFMDIPIERMLADRESDFPFCVMWCNESWTRAWVDKERSIIAEQKYSDDLVLDLADDLARFFVDPRYVRIGERPLFIVYRPSFLPDAPHYLEKIRSALMERHGIDVMLTMAQTDMAVDPRPFGLDGAIEFTANKFNRRLTRKINPFEVFDPEFAASIHFYDELMQLSLSEATPDYPLVRSVMPSWDKNPRRPGRGHVIHGSTPRKFAEWTEQLTDRSVATPFHGEPLLFVNAWNEWAESAYLEPDTHFGGAYLNSLARAVFR